MPKKKSKASRKGRKPAHGSSDDKAGSPKNIEYFDTAAHADEETVENVDDWNLDVEDASPYMYPNLLVNIFDYVDVISGTNSVPLVCSLWNEMWASYNTEYNELRGVVESIVQKLDVFVPNRPFNGLNVREALDTIGCMGLDDTTAVVNRHSDELSSDSESESSDEDVFDGEFENRNQNRRPRGRKLCPSLRMISNEWEAARSESVECAELPSLDPLLLCTGRGKYVYKDEWPILKRAVIAGLLQWAASDDPDVSACGSADDDFDVVLGSVSPISKRLASIAMFLKDMHQHEASDAVDEEENVSTEIDPILGGAFSPPGRYYSSYQPVAGRTRSSTSDTSGKRPELPVRSLVLRWVTSVGELDEDLEYKYIVNGTGSRKDRKVQLRAAFRKRFRLITLLSLLFQSGVVPASLIHDTIVRLLYGSGNYRSSTKSLGGIARKGRSLSSRFSKSPVPSSSPSTSRSAEISSGLLDLAISPNKFSLPDDQDLSMSGSFVSTSSAGSNDMTQESSYDGSQMAGTNRSRDKKWPSSGDIDQACIWLRYCGPLLESFSDDRAYTDTYFKRLMELKQLSERDEETVTTSPKDVPHLPRRSQILVQTLIALRDDCAWNEDMYITRCTEGLQGDLEEQLSDSPHEDVVPESANERKAFDMFEGAAGPKPRRKRATRQTNADIEGTSARSLPAWGSETEAAATLFPSSERTRSQSAAENESQPSNTTDVWQTVRRGRKG